MHAIMQTRFGSHLYGTSTPASDIDTKTIHIPSARQILLGVAKGSISTRRPKAIGERNVAGEDDSESYSLHKFVQLLAEGQTVAIDMLFAPPSAMLMEPSPVWNTLVANKNRLLTRKSAKFVGYCRQQSNKYGIKGSRVAAARAALMELEIGVAGLGTQAKLREMSVACHELAAEHDHIAIVPILSKDTEILHLEVCGLKMPFTATIKNARDVMDKLVDEYGHRALAAEQNKGVDWKALSHAVRVGRQAIELMQTGEVRFPLEYADHLIAIKTGQLAYAQVAAEIEGLLDDVEAAAATSTLPDEPDTAWIEDFVVNAYGCEIVRDFGLLPFWQNSPCSPAVFC